MTESKTKINELLNEAPPEFIEAFKYITNNDLTQASVYFNIGIPKLKSSSSPWTGSAYCCYAYCLKLMGKFNQALENAITGKEFGLNLLGEWYYYEVTDDTLNNLDRLDEALEASNEAIDFFTNVNSVGDMVSHLERKANICKQLAAGLSKNENSLNIAKTNIIEAIHSICKSLSLIPDDWEEIKEELHTISRIAARTGVLRSELVFLDSMKNIESIINTYFSASTLSRTAVSEYSNMAFKSVSENDRASAIIYFQKALNASIEENEQDIGFKAFIAYQYGLCLLKHHNLESITSDPSHLEIKQQIKSLWETTISCYNKLSSETIVQFNHNFKLTDCVWNINRDPIMQINSKGR